MMAMKLRLFFFFLVEESFFLLTHTRSEFTIFFLFFRAHQRLLG